MLHKNCCPNPEVHVFGVLCRMKAWTLVEMFLVRVSNRHYWKCWKELWEFNLVIWWLFLYLYHLLLKTFQGLVIYDAISHMELSNFLGSSCSNKGTVCLKFMEMCLQKLFLINLHFCQHDKKEEKERLISQPQSHAHVKLLKVVCFLQYMLRIFSPVPTLHVEVMSIRNLIIPKKHYSYISRA